jgi:hypothetical protein
MDWLKEKITIRKDVDIPGANSLVVCDCGGEFQLQMVNTLLFELVILT